MRKIDEKISELFNILTEAALLNTVLNTLIVFLISYIFFSLFNLIPLALSTIISMIYLLYIWIKKSSFYDIKLVEKKFPFLKERLSTAKETLNKENFVINALRIDVSRRINHIDALAFYRIGKTIIKIAFILIILFGIMYISANDIKITNLNDKLSKINFGKTNINLEENETVNELIEEFDPTKIEEYKNFKKEEFISYEDIEAIGSKEFRDTITDEEKEIVKRYFETISLR